MRFGELLQRAWDTIWEHKYLILLGILVALGGGNASAGARHGGGSGGSEQGFIVPPSQWSSEIPNLRVLAHVGLPVAGAILLFLLAGLVIVIGIALWVVATIARGGLIAGADTAVGGGRSSFGEAWQAGWQKGWRLLGISVLPAIPVLMLAVLGTLAFASSAIFAEVFSDFPIAAPLAGLGAITTGLTCVLLPISLFLVLLQAFANRACVLENLGVFASYKRGIEVLIGNLGEVVLLFLIQILVAVLLALAATLPSLLLALCCLLWPTLIFIQGTVAAYFSTLWTLAWREWTGEDLSTTSSA
jgi:hypothetical protein